MRRLLLFYLMLSFTLSGCQTLFSAPSHLKGNILLWHSWSKEDAQVLDEVLSQITEIEPDTEVISFYVPPNELKEHFIVATQQGLGPDLLLAPSDWVHDFAEAGVARPITLDELNVNHYVAPALASVYYQETYYAFPLSVFPVALYYNTQLTSSPPVTLAGLKKQTEEEGESIALTSRFEPAYWGIQAYGANLFDDAGRFTLAQSGFTDWLDTLTTVQHWAGVILNTDALALEEMFVEGRVTYYAAGPESLQEIQQIMGDAVGVTLLPSGPVGPAGPLLPTEAIYLGSTSSSKQTEAALRVAQFLTNPQQNMVFMRELGRVPANQTVMVDPRVYPVLSGFAQQAQTSVTLPNDLFRDEFYELGDRVYANVLSGVLTPEEAVCQFGLDVVALQGYTEEEATLPEGCSAPDQGEQR